jgi:hypothetical protein
MRRFLAPSGRLAINPNGGIMPALNALPNHLKPCHEKVFGFARGIAHDRNARVRIEAYVKAWNPHGHRLRPERWRESEAPARRYRASSTAIATGAQRASM